LTPIDFFLQYLLLTLASVTSAIILAILGFFTIKRMISKAMGSKEVQDLKDALDNLRKELEKLKDQFVGHPEGYRA